MKKSDYLTIETYMLSCMRDSAHDKEHIYRVLFTALRLAEGTEADRDVLIAACLLHDIGRQEQFENPTLCHARVGAKKARRFLAENGFSHSFVEQVAHCIAAHRFRSDNPPQTLEAKLLFDADKIDATGTLGIARTLYYNGTLGEPLYTRNADGAVLDGSGAEPASFFQEYHFKLRRVYDKLLTEQGKALAEQRRASAVHFYESMLNEVSGIYSNGASLLDGLISD